MFSFVKDKLLWVVDKLLDPLEYLILKPLKINTNTFFSYIFGLLIIYFTVDRSCEIISLLLTGQLVNYWTPIQYGLVYLCIVAGYSITCGSPLNTTITHPMKFFVFYSICGYIIIFSMAAQWINELLWFICMHFRNFKIVATELPELIGPAFSSLSLLFPAFSIRGVVDYYIGNILDGDIDWIESFEDYKGIKLESSKSKKASSIPSAFKCDAKICIDDKTGKPAVIPEKVRFEATFVEGATGTGKTATIVEPMCAGDIEKKYFFRELSKKLGYNALQAGMATLEVPYSNDYLNRNFNLSFLVPKDSRKKEYKNYVKDMLKYEDPETGKLYYRGLGLTLVAPDNACISRVQNVAKAYDVDVNVIDPMDPNSLGINPFIGTDPAKIASIISVVLKGMYESENASSNNVFFANVTQQAFENLAILLKLVYPRMHGGELPSLEDMLDILNNFDLAEEMTEVLKKDEQLANDYKSLIGYFEKNFYKPPVNIHGYEIASTYGSGRKETEKFVYGAITQLDNFLRNPGIKRVLCSKNNNINLDKALEEGQIITACTRQGDLGELHQKAFGMFVILSLKDAVLRRPGTEDSRTPHFIYIDEFPLYITKDTEAFFTLFRKYRCGTLITVQNLSQLTKTSSLAYFKDVIITNSKTRIVFGDMTWEEAEYWQKEMGTKKKWKYDKVLADSKTQEGADKLTQSYMKGSKDYPANYKAVKFVNMGFKKCIYKTKSASGKNIVGRGATDFINKKHLEKHKFSSYNFEIFGHGSANKPTEDTSAFFTGDEYKETFPTFTDNNYVNTKATILNNKNGDIYVDANNDGVNDFSIITPYETYKKNNTSSQNGDSSVFDTSKNSDGIVVDIKK